MDRVIDIKTAAVMVYFQSLINENSLVTLPELLKASKRLQCNAYDENYPFPDNSPLQCLAAVSFNAEDVGISPLAMFGLKSLRHVHFTSAQQLEYKCEIRGNHVPLLLPKNVKTISFPAAFKNDAFSNFMKANQHVTLVDSPIYKHN